MSSYLAEIARGVYSGAVRPALRALSVSFALAALAVSAPAAAQEPGPPPDAWLGGDKPVHALAAGWTAGAGYAAGIELGWEPADRRRGAIAAGLAVSIGKEAYDRWTRRGPFSFKDLAADAVGIAAFVALSAALDR